MSRVTSLSEIIQSFLTGWTSNSRVKTGLAYYYWPQVIGEALKDKTEVTQVKNGILWVKTPDPALAYNLTFFKNEIINKYRRFLGAKAIHGVRITVGELSVVYDFGKKGKTRTDPSPPLDLSLPPAIAEIEDPEVKSAFSRFYYSHEARKKEV